jgi:hypothetical protein
MPNRTCVSSTSSLLLAALLLSLAALQGCVATGSNTVISDRGQHQRGPISEVEAETLQNQRIEAISQRDAAAANLRNATNPELRRKLQQAVFDYNQMIALYEGRLRSAGRAF